MFTASRRQFSRPRLNLCVVPIVERTFDLQLFIPQKRGLKQSRLLTVRSSLGYMANVDIDGNH